MIRKKCVCFSCALGIVNIEKQVTQSWNFFFAISEAQLFSVLERYKLYLSTPENGKKWEQNEYAHTKFIFQCIF